MDLYKIPFLNKVFEKKNHFDYIQVIPKGLDCYILVEYNNVFNFYHIDNTTDTPLLNKIPFLKKCIPNVNIPNVLFKGTIINNKLLSITDIIYVNKVFYIKNSDRLYMLKMIFTKNPVLYTNDILIFSIPHMFHNYNSYRLEYNTIPYEVNYIEYKYLNNNILQNPITFYYNHITYNAPKLAEYYVMAEVMSDIYKLYTDKNIFIGFAHIPNYSVSVYMNSIFRNIKENQNLDILEESEDEEDFENSETNKYVDLTKKVKMKCVFNEKFKKWVPNIIIV
jgi:hypothetical protein